MFHPPPLCVNKKMRGYQLNRHFDIITFSGGMVRGDRNYPLLHRTRTLNFNTKVKKNYREKTLQNVCLSSYNNEFPTWDPPTLWLPEPMTYLRFSRAFRSEVFLPAARIPHIMPEFTFKEQIS
jgi:hypothetical protein